MNPLVIFVPLAALGALLLISPQAHAAGRPLLRAPADARPELVNELAHKWSPVFDVPVSWVRSQAYAESRNVLTAENSRTGALGVLQLMPATAMELLTRLMKSKFAKRKDVSSTLKSKWTGKKEDLFDPDLNVMLATFYMRLLKQKFGNNHELVAAAYNAGPGKVSKRLSSGRPLSTESLTYLSMVAEAKNRGFM
jgi:soluble lytic murein transglycosylase-like protein